MGHLTSQLRVQQEDRLDQLFFGVVLNLQCVVPPTHMTVGPQIAYRIHDIRGEGSKPMVIFLNISKPTSSNITSRQLASVRSLDMQAEQTSASPIDGVPKIGRFILSDRAYLSGSKDNTFKHEVQLIANVKTNLWSSVRICFASLSMSVHQLVDQDIHSCFSC